MNQTADLELNIHRQDQQSYAVDFRYTDSDPDNQTDVRLGAKQQALVTIDFSALHEMMLTGDFLAYGKALTQSFFADEALRTAFAQVRATTERAQAALRIRLAIGPSAPELYALRWETLLDPQSGQSLATDHAVHFSRYLSSLDWRPVRLRARGELQALAAIAAPTGLEQYKLASADREKELATIQGSIGAIKLHALEHSTLNGIIVALTAAPIDILYLVAHGTLAENNVSILWLEDEQGQIQRFNGSELVGRLRELENRPRLVVLVSCQSAGKGAGDVLATLGPRLAEVGIPAVLAMQGNVRMETIAKFMPVFFDELQKDGRIDRALNVARGQIRDQPDWWMPVLFMRLTNGRLWNEQLTKERLKSIANQSLDAHHTNFAFTQVGEEAQEIFRDIHPTIIKTLRHSSKSTIGISGPSGIGKSTLLGQVGRDINDNNLGIALWIPASLLSTVASIDELLLTILRKQDPALDSYATLHALTLALQTDMGLVLLVDDINRIPNPSEAFDALNVLSATATSQNASIHFVVPLWPGQIAFSPDENTAQKDWDFVHLGNYSEGESKRYSANILYDNKPQIEQLIRSLGYDPFLIGLATQGSLSEYDEKIDLLSKTFEQTINKAINDARAISNQSATVGEFNKAIDSLVRLMLDKGIPEPLWENIEESLGQRQTVSLRDIAKINRLGWIDGGDVWRWKHARLRDMLVGRWLAKNILQRIDESNVSDTTKILLDDPGIAEAFALAFVFLPEDSRQRALKVVASHQPLALIEILQLGLFSYHSQLNKIVIQGLREIIAGVDQKQEVFVASPGHIVLYNLSQITNPVILDITDGLAIGWSSRMARFRNGDLNAGMPALLRYADDPVILWGNFPFLEQAIRDFGEIRSNEKAETISELQAQLIDSKHANTVLYIGSILKWPELIENLWNIWINLEQDAKLGSLAVMIWFLSGYDDLAIKSKLKTALLMYLEMSNIDQNKNHISLSFREPLRLALTRQSISETAIQVWAQTILDNDGLRKSIAYLLGGIDHPKALDVYLRYGRIFGGQTGKSFDPMDENITRGVPIKSEESRDYLWQIVLRESDSPIRGAAFNLLEGVAKLSDLPMLQTLSKDDVLFESALELRLRLRDKTATAMLIERINENPHEWCRFAPLLAYEPGVFDAVLNNLEKARAEQGFYFYVNSIFYRLPAEQIRQIVIGKEQLLMDSPEAWPALWFSGEEVALKFVVQAIKQSKKDGKTEEHLEHFFFFGGSRFHTGISIQMLNALLPVLNCFPKESLKWLADLTLRQGFRSWTMEHLEDVLKSDELVHFKWVYAENIIATLADAARYVDDGMDEIRKKSTLLTLESRFENRDNNYSYAANLVDAVKIWLKNSPNSNNLIISARIISGFGTSDDIEWWLLQKPSDTREKAFIVWNNALYYLRRRRWQTT